MSPGRQGERGRALWPRRGPDQLECEGSRARGPALRESPSPRLWKKLWHRGGWAASATQAACAQTLCITRWEPGRPGRGRRLRGEQRGGRGGAPGGAPPSRPRDASKMVPRGEQGLWKDNQRSPGPAVPLVQQMLHPDSCCGKTSCLNRGHPPRPAWRVCGPGVRQIGDAWRREGGRKGRKEGVCEELRQLLPTPRSSPPSHAAGLLLTHPVPPTEARGQGCSGGFEVTERRTGRKKNQMGREGTIT